MGELGLLPHDFYCMTWVNYSRYVQGYRIRMARGLEASRMIAHTLVWTNIQKGKPIPKAEKLWPLITDPEPEIINPVVPAEEFKVIKNRYMELWQRKKA